MVSKYLSHLRAKYTPDVVIVNNENISHGKGPRMNQIRWCEEMGIDIFTGWNHSLESVEDICEYLNSPESKQLRPDNIVGDNIPGTGQRVFTFWTRKILVINLLGSIFMSEISVLWVKCLLENPYQRINKILDSYNLVEFEAILVDFHKEATSEGNAMANHLDGRVSILWGTHTHIQTADAEIWPRGLGFINDLWFAWARMSLVGVDWESSKHRFIEGRQEWLMSPDESWPWVLSGMFVQILERKCVKIEPFRILE